MTLKTTHFLIGLTGTKAEVEALTSIQEGRIAYATDTDELGTFDGSIWHWGSLDVTVADYSDISANDTATDVTGAELETLTDGSNADSLHAHSFLLPFGIFTDVNPLTADGSLPFAATVDRDMTLVNWEQGAYVATTNDGSNYWQITLVYAKAGTSPDVDIVTVDTSAVAANGWQKLTTASFSPSSITESIANILYVRCVKVGSPGNLYIAGPALKVRG